MYYLARGVSCEHCMTNYTKYQVYKEDINTCESVTVIDLEKLCFTGVRLMAMFAPSMT